MQIGFDLKKEILKRTMRVPVPVNDITGEGTKITRQLDSALMSVGFKMSAGLCKYLSLSAPAVVQDIARDVLTAVRELVGDQVEHNVYFRDFPENVPDTMEFWTECIIDALFDPDSAGKVALQLSFGVVNLLDLPKYGKYQHSYEEMLDAHEEFIPSAKDRVTILHLGKTLQEEALNLYHSLAGSSIPLNQDDKELLCGLAEICISEPQPEEIPVRENKAIINQVRLDNGHDLLLDTPTDVLRLACGLSGGDVTLLENTKFKSFAREVRRALLAGLDDLIEKSPAKIADVNQYSEMWKRLGERLHPHEYPQWSNAQDVFAVARGDKKVQSLAGKVELAFANSNIGEATTLLANAPGMLFRNLDRLMRLASEQEVEALLGVVATVIPKVSGRVVLSLREHLQNRLAQGQRRIFANSRGTAWVAEDSREPLGQDAVDKFCKVFDQDLLRRVPETERLIVDKEVLNLAVPISDKNKASGFAIIPRGSVSSVSEGILRFFMYWKQHHRRTDYDLSAVMLDADFEYIGHLSYTNLRDTGGVHSGDLTEAPKGASEFIDIELGKVECKYIVPQVNIYAGESFLEAEESFFGFMERAPEQKGRPFEARVVRMKSDIRGNGKVALPLVFAKGEDGNWTAKWLHLYLNGTPNFNRVEENRINTALLARSIMERKYLCLDYLVELMRQRAESFSWYEGQEIQEGPVTFIGLEVPEGLPADSIVISIANLQELIPK